MTAFFRLFIAGTKTLAALLTVSLLSLFVIAAKTKYITDDIWKQLGLTLPEEQNNIN